MKNNLEQNDIHQEAEFCTELLKISKCKDLSLKVLACVFKARGAIKHHSLLGLKCKAKKKIQFSTLGRERIVEVEI